MAFNLLKVDGVLVSLKGKEGDATNIQLAIDGLCGKNPLIFFFNFILNLIYYLFFFSQIVMSHM
jgi:hypothetical protein